MEQEEDQGREDEGEIDRTVEERGRYRCGCAGHLDSGEESKLVPLLERLWWSSSIGVEGVACL